MEGFFLYNLQPTNTGSSLHEGQEGQQAGEPPGACLGERGPRGDVWGPREGTGQCRGGLRPLCPSSAHPQETQGQSLLLFHSHLGAGGGQVMAADGWMDAIQPCAPAVPPPCRSSPSFISPLGFCFSPPFGACPPLRGCLRGGFAPRARLGSTTGPGAGQDHPPHPSPAVSLPL